MDQENPTAGDGGASITDRIESFLAAQDAPEQTPEPTQAETQAKEPNAAPEVEPEEGATEEQQPQISTADLAKLLGVDESLIDLDEDGTAKFKTKIDGKEGAAKFAEFLKTHQIQGHAENRAREVAAKEAAIQARMQEVEQQAQAKLQHIEQLGNVAAQELMREYQSIDWNALRAADPGQYAALRADFQERNGKLQQVFQTVQQQAQHRQAQAAMQRQEFIAKQAERLPDLIPEWKDSAVANKEREEIRAWATKAGFEASELDGFVLAHHVKVMRNAMLYDKLQESKAAVEKKVRAAPVLVKPGQSQQVDSKTQSVRNLRAQVKASGGKSGIEELLMASGKV